MFYFTFITFTALVDKTALASGSGKPAASLVSYHTVLLDEQEQPEKTKIVRSHVHVEGSETKLEPELKGETRRLMAIDAEAHFQTLPSWEEASDGQVISLKNKKQTQTPPSAAGGNDAFEVSGLADSFDGVYLPSLQHKDSNDSTCNSNVIWEMRSGDSSNGFEIHLLYYMKGHWILGRIGENVSYNGTDSGSCEPTLSTAWRGVGEGTANVISIIIRHKDADGLQHSVSASRPRQSFKVEGAGLSQFDGTYYMTDKVVPTGKCQRSFAKDSPTCTEYTLFFADDLWWFEEKYTSRKPYFGKDINFDCEPDSVVWVPSTVSTDADSKGVTRASAASDTQHDQTEHPAAPVPTVTLVNPPVQAPADAVCTGAEDRKAAEANADAEAKAAGKADRGACEQVCDCEAGKDGCSEGKADCDAHICTDKVCRHDCTGLFR